MKAGLLYLILLENKLPLNIDVIQRHVAHLKALDGEGGLVACGPFADYPGGMVLIKAASAEEAHGIAQNDPFVKEGYKNYSIRTVDWANKGNNYGLE
ncbi:MAG TPA: YciI family protein [Feifaniaceae bacterium]|nr:YciI family protein [Feifaniaceae bacterium]